LIGAAFLGSWEPFLTTAWEEPVHFVSVIFTVVVSIVLHELAHGYAALAQGDDTPRRLGHITLDPLVHMGVFSIVVLLIAGIAWGQTPVDPTRFRGRFGEALVAVAGPAVNLVLALLGLTAFALWVRFAGGPAEGGLALNFQSFLLVFGVTNLVLCLFNLLPVPPLDGASVVADFVPPYRRFVRDPDNQGVFFALFVGVFVLAPRLFDVAYDVAGFWIRLIAR
jgi:Zn-dependent protease